MGECIMCNYDLYLAGFGFSDKYLGSPSLSSFVIHRKGEIWRRKTGEKYQENIFKYRVSVSYEAGFGPAIDEIITLLNKDVFLSHIVASCKYVELQVKIETDDDLKIPHMHFTDRQMYFLGLSGIDLEVNIGY